MDERTFLRGAVAGGAIATAGGLGLRALLREPPPWNEAAFPPPGDARVAVLTATDYEGPLESTVLEGLRAIDADVVGANVLVKPNLVESSPGPQSTPNRDWIAATALALRGWRREVRVGEGHGHPRHPSRGHPIRPRGCPRRGQDEFADLNHAGIQQVSRPSRSRLSGPCSCRHPCSRRTSSSRCRR